jgi:hypothetical protein
MNGQNMRHSHRRHGTGRPRRRPVGARAAVGLAAGVIGLAGLAWLGLASQHDPGRSPAPAAGPASPSAPSAPTSPPVRVCGNDAILGGGPSSRPPGAVTVPAGDDSGVDWSQAHTTYWFAPGTHFLGPGQYTHIVPGAGSVFIGAPGAVLDGRHTNFYAFAGDAPHVTISYLTIRNFGTHGGNQNEGVVNHDSAAGWTIDHSTLAGNAGAGTMLGSHNTLSHDCLKDNQQYGFDAFSPGGPAKLVLDHNEIVGNDTYNWESHVSDCGCSGGGKFWGVNGAVITQNWVHDNHGVGLWADTNNRGFEIVGNYIEGNDSTGLMYETSYNALVKNNTFVRNGLVAGPKNPGFPTSAIYVSESGSDHRVPGKYSTTFSITGNRFINNWGGVILWENADRFCGSPSNTSSGNCTLVNPSTVTVSSCNAVNINRPLFYNGCRWKTQNVQVVHNVFDFNPADIGPSCTEMNSCGFQGMFSQYGTYPSWSPYKARAVENHITFDQDNHFMSNTYNGPWRFMVHEQGNTVPWPTWQAGPYGQDAGSTMNGLGA